MDVLHQTVDGRLCHIYGKVCVDTCIICGMANHRPNEIADTANLFYKADGTENVRLIIFETNDWNGDFSPWPSETAFGGESFAGKAGDTLDWLTGSLLSYLYEKELIPAGVKKYIAGYSLSGLFALWAFLELNEFDGAASCSGSLWFPGWLEYMGSHRRNQAGIVYLSLGSKEEKTKNSLMVSVGDNTRECYAMLKQDNHISKTTLVWNKGGHFANPTERLVKGMLWLLENGSYQNEKTRRNTL